MKITTAMIKANNKSKVRVEIVPCLPRVKVFINALGISATMPEKIISEIPLPIPLLVTCSPSPVSYTHLRAHET